MKPCLITFVGDISLNGIYDDLLIRRGPSYPFAQVKEILSKADVVVGNLESPFVSQEASPAFPRKTPLRAYQGYAVGLREAGFKALNLSNNHILDYGEHGVAVTRDLLAQNNIENFGYGNNYEAARGLKIVPCGRLKVGFMGYTDVVIESPFYATGDSPGIAQFEIEKAKYEVRECKQLVDVLVVSLHWGIEYFHLPSPGQISQARELIEHGADVIYGHHPHTIQGIERYKNGLIAYSLGNFIFSDIKWEWLTDQGEKRTTHYKFLKKHRKSFILQIMLDDSGVVDHSMHGVSLSEKGQVINDGGVIRRMERLSNILTRHDYEKYFSRELKRFRILSTIKQTIPRLKRFYKLRPKHIREMLNILWDLRQSR